MTRREFTDEIQENLLTKSRIEKEQKDYQKASVKIIRKFYAKVSVEKMGSIVSELRKMPLCDGDIDFLSKIEDNYPNSTSVMDVSELMGLCDDYFPKIFDDVFDSEEE